MLRWLVFNTAHISINAPRTGSDDKVQSVDVITFDFNPRSPHGERQALEEAVALGVYFNPRSPHGERRWTT